MVVPLALRFPRQPLLCLLAQALTNCLLSPYPTYGDIALWLVGGMGVKVKCMLRASPSQLPFSSTRCLSNDILSAPSPAGPRRHSSCPA